MKWFLKSTNGLLVLIYHCSSMGYDSKRYYSVLLPPSTAFNINPALIVHLLNALGSILARYHFSWAHTCHIKQQIKFASYRVHTWMEIINVDKVSCWRTKSDRHLQKSNPQPFDPESRVQFIPQHLNNLACWPTDYIAWHGYMG